MQLSRTGRNRKSRTQITQSRNRAMNPTPDPCPAPFNNPLSAAYKPNDSMAYSSRSQPIQEVSLSQQRIRAPFATL